MQRSFCSALPLSHLSMELNICPQGLVKTNILNTHHAALSIPLPSLLLHAVAASLVLLLPIPIPPRSPNTRSHVWNPAWGQLTPSYRSLSVSCISERSPLGLITNGLRLESTSENSSPSQHLVQNWTQRRFSETDVGWLINWHWSW